MNEKKDRIPMPKLSHGSGERWIDALTREVAPSVVGQTVSWVDDSRRSQTWIVKKCEYCQKLFWSQWGRYKFCSCSCSNNGVKNNSGRFMSCHGLSKTRPHTAWCNIIARCLNPKRREYSRYGGRGIAIDDEWRKDFSAFWRDMGPTYSDNLTIDRIDNNKGYFKENCRWIPAVQQARNQSTNVRLSVGGVEMLQIDIPSIIGASLSAVSRAYLKAKKSNKTEFTCKSKVILIL